MNKALPRRTAVRSRPIAARAGVLRRLALTLAALATALAGIAPLRAEQHLPTPLPAQPVPAPRLARPALWRISQGSTTIWLFGTIHLLPRNIEWMTPTLAGALDSSNELVTEIPETDPQSSAQAVLQRGVLPPGQSLRAMMTPREQRRYAAAMAAIGLPVEAFDRFKPWYAAVVMATLPLQKKGYAVERGVEAELSDRAKAAGHPRSGLETMDFQLALFDSLSPAVQKRYLFSVIDELPKLDADVNAMIGAWSEGNAGKLAALLNAEEDDPAMTAALLTNRNRNWVRWIEARLRRPGQVFIAVGAGHLGGRGGVADMLAREGVRIERVQ